MRADVETLLRDYPRIFFACHRRHVRDEATSRVLSAHQASILDHLDDVEGTDLTRLAGHMGVTLSTMSLAIDRLARGGYVTRTRDAADARRVQLRLTSDGVRIKRAQSVLEPALVAQLLDQLSPAERDEALRGLATLARAADTMRQAAFARRRDAGAA
ncbi:MAG TPA: MarR family transcriptional regulator [Gemmatimonadaceae bacterium]|nr:MarR family transcriptional regulator [Gemmatimonadaceae bacterium]